MSGPGWAIYDTVEQLLSRQGRVKQWADGKFNTVLLQGTKVVDDGSSKKIQLDNDTEYSVIPLNTSSNGAYLHGNLKWAQSIGYIGTRDISKIRLNLAKYGAPSTAGNFIVEIREGSPSGALVGSATIPLTSITVTPTLFDFNINFSITKNTLERFIVIYLSISTGDGNNFYYATIAQSYIHGKRWHYDGSDWAIYETSPIGFILTTTKVTEGYVTQAITDDSLGQFLNAHHTIVANSGSVSVDLLDALGNVLTSGIHNGGDLKSVPNPESHTTFILRADITRPTANSDTPELKWWGISFIGDTT